MSIMRRLLRFNGSAPRGVRGCRAYAVGDIHGRKDLLDQILAAIEADLVARPVSKAYTIFLGDLIDRGPDSAGVVQTVKTLHAERPNIVCLGGNHEEILVQILDGETGVLANWLKFGGAECAKSYGVDPEELRGMPEASARALLQKAVPADHADFIRGMADTFRFGDYLFVHAGIRPGLAVEDQDRSDLRWIREPFLSDSKDHGLVVVHGHTITEQVEDRRNRIGIDTGAYRTGILSAVVIEDHQRRYLSTSAEKPL